MGKSRKQDKYVPQARSRTRSQKPKLSNLDTTNQDLNARLRSLGLYAAATKGDGNCLFRALSDQMFGTSNHHLTLRAQICDFIESRKEEYAGFIDDERGIDKHLDCMRQSGTYAGHVELSAFARLFKRDIKVVQPSLVFVIDFASLVRPYDDDMDHPSNKYRRKEPPIDEPTSSGTIYVAYHDYEHYSSIRNLKGPHNGLPNVMELPPDEVDSDAEPPPIAMALSKHKQKAMRGKARKPIPLNHRSKFLKDEYLRSSEVPSISVTPSPSPFNIPLPESRGTSPATSLLSSEPSQDSSQASHNLPLTPPDTQILRRSPKRSFDETDGNDTGDGSIDGRRIRSNVVMKRPSAAVDFDSDSSLSPPPELVAPAKDKRTDGFVSTSASIAEKPLTRRQRKKMGLPPQRKNVIVIPGGKHPARIANRQLTDEERQAGRAFTSSVQAEWEKNGVGRVDSRGFKELHI